MLTLGNSPFKTPFEPRPLEEESAQMYHQRDLTDTDSLEAFLFDSSTGHAVSPTGVKKEDDSSMTLESTMPFSYAAASNTSSLTAEDHHQHPWDLFTSFDASDLFSSPNGDASSSSTSLSVEGGNHLAAPSLPEGQGQQLQPPPAPRLVPSYNGSSTLLSKSQIPDTSPFSLSLSAHQNHYHPSSPRTNGANWDAFDLFSSNDGSSLGLLNVFDDSRSTSAQQLSHFDLDSTRGTRFDVDPTLIYCPFVSKTEPEEGEYSSRMRPEALQKGVSSLIAASSASASLSSTTFGQDRLSMIVADYEANPDRECTILILHAKVVQKSYGSEKRYI